MSATLQQNQINTKVLIVEDEGEMCLLLNILLDGEEMTVDHVQTLSAAEEYLLQHEPSIILLDNRLPDGYGLDFINFLKRNYPSVKILMIAGIDFAAKDVAIENGANGFLEKPFSKSQLLNAIRGLVD